MSDSSQDTQVASELSWNALATILRSVIYETVHLQAVLSGRGVNRAGETGPIMTASI